ncbi:MAG: hypothetical protein QOC76_1388 [Mycobacterium sp.]|jgi:hypothetical protein|nr:hypothetical protein [Mycobacterium sp.]
MTTATNPYPDVALPAGARTLDTWQSDDPLAYRVILAADRKITDHALTLSPSAIQWADGTIDGGRIEPPQIFVYDLGEGSPLNSDQARELASALIETAREIDQWVTR